MRFLKVFIAGAVLLAGVVAWILYGVDHARSETAGFCGVTRIGEPLPQAERRAHEHGLELEKVGSRRGAPETYTAISTSMGRRFGCTLEIQNGRVIATHAGELPPQ